MSNEHNPIAQLVTKIQSKWNTEIVPHEEVKLVRWLIKPEQARLYEGFLRLESTQHGSIPDMTVVLMTEFQNKDTHSKNLIKDWITQYRKDEDIIKEIGFKWDVAAIEKKIDTTSNDKLLLEIIGSFQKALPDKKRTLTLCLFPHSVYNFSEYSKWVHKIMKIELVDKTRLMIFDYARQRYFDFLFKKHKEQAKSLSLAIDLNGAINKLTSSGDPNDPDVQFRQCIVNMSKAVEKSDLSGVNRWGKRGLDITQKMGIKSIYASAYLIYASMLMSFKEFEKIDDLLLKAVAVAKQGIKAEDETCKSLLIQCYGYQASSKHLQKKKKDAFNLYCKQADTAIDFGVGQLSLNAWWLAYNVIKKKDKEQYKSTIKKAYTYGENLEKEALKSTTMAFIAEDYYLVSENNNDEQECKRIDDFMITVDGALWRENVVSQKKEMEKKKLPILNWF